MRLLKGGAAGRVRQTTAASQRQVNLALLSRLCRRRAPWSGTRLTPNASPGLLLLIRVCAGSGVTVPSTPSLESHCLLVATVHVASSQRALAKSHTKAWGRGVLMLLPSPVLPTPNASGSRALLRPVHMLSLCHDVCPRCLSNVHGASLPQNAVTPVHMMRRGPER